MSEITDEMVETAARAAMNTARARGGLPPLGDIDEGFQDADLWRAEARAALSAVAPLITAQEREAMRALLTDPAAVRVNILRGGVAIPSDLVWLHDTDGPVAAKVRAAVEAEREACWQAAMAAMSCETNASRRRVSAAIRARAESKEG